MKASAVAIVLVGLVCGLPSTASAQSASAGPFELDVMGLMAASGAYVHRIGDGRFSVGGRVGWAWEWEQTPNPFLWSGATFEYPIFEPLHVDAIARVQFTGATHHTYVQLETGPTLMRYAWGDDGAGSGLFAGVHIGAGVGWRKVSGGMSVRVGHASNHAGNAPIVPPSSTGMLWTPYVRIAF